MATTTGTCPYYSTTSYAQCSIAACPGDTIAVSGCGECTGQQKFYIYSGSTQLASFYGGCGDDVFASNVCSALTYQVPNTGGACSTFTLRESSNWSGSVSTGTVSWVVTPFQAPSAKPTAIPTIAPSQALPVYFEMYNTTTCSGLVPELRGIMQSGGDCFSSVYEDEDVYTMVTCASTSPNSAWSFNTYDNSNCAGTPVTTSSGVGTCDCAVASVGNTTASVYVNCAGDMSLRCNTPPPTFPPTFTTNPNSNGSNGSSDAATTGIIVGVVVGVVALVAIVVSVAFYNGMCTSTKPLAKSPETEMNTNL